ncbi:hypothetical protein [Sphingomonas sp. CROZ-RG-20F-R02-07]|uniref:hypothetical protein n=1 Tax=Sphingomonas sp. CROZ-RG-20F-R02-07 TaxID=2914832 RepID=UPI001F57BADA|nr:hypothetical protein [Sphingomonas sp. CROZ-RG-20F-R02-07]
MAVFAGVLAFLRMRRENEELHEQMKWMKRDHKAHTSSYAKGDQERTRDGSGSGPVNNA